MNKTKSLIFSMRLRTLPLSLAGVVLGILLACEQHRVPWPVIVFTLLTTVLLQILSNMSNELGDYLQGTDGEGREGVSQEELLLCGQSGLGGADGRQGRKPDRRADHLELQAGHQAVAGSGGVLLRGNDDRQPLGAGHRI